MDALACQRCSAVPERVVDGRAQLPIVRHAPGFLTLQAQVRARWPTKRRAFRTRQRRHRSSVGQEPASPSRRIRAAAITASASPITASAAAAAAFASAASARRAPSPRATDNA